MSNFVELKNITKAFDKQLVVDDFSLSIEKGKMVTLLGPSGCGKTTILRLIAGLETPTSGQIFIDGEDVTQTSIQQRDICIVFQSYALFPHMSIGENVGYGLNMLGIPKEEKIARIQEALSLVDLAGFDQRYVDQISGGQQQRVALARALVLKPKVLLFDEPLSNLDANLRRSMREKIRTLQQHLNTTAVYVTHDQSEAFAVSDEVVVMRAGKIMQQGSAAQLYQAPNSLFMANFMGESNIIQGNYDAIEHVVNVNGYQIPLNKNDAMLSQTSGQYHVGIRPEAIKLIKSGLHSQLCHVEAAVYMGAYWEIALKWGNENLVLNINHINFDADGAEQAYLHIDPKGIFLIPIQQEESN